MTAIEILFAAASGGIVGIVLGLVGGGGSILAVPLLGYLVGVTNRHRGKRAVGRGKRHPSAGQPCARAPSSGAVP